MLLLAPPRKSRPAAFRSAIRDLVWQNALDAEGTADTTALLMRAYMTEREAAGLKTPSVPADKAEDFVQAAYVAERMKLGKRGFAEDHYIQCFTYPDAMQFNDGNIPVSFLTELAHVLAHRDHAEDETMYGLLAHG